MKTGRLLTRLDRDGRSTWLPALIAFVVIVTAWIFAEHQNARIFQQEVRARTASQVSLLRAKLEGNINANIQLTRGLTAAVATEPGMSQARFAQLGAELMRIDSQIRHLAGAPDLVVSMIYPYGPNRRALGLNYNENPDQRDAALRARDTRDLVLAGPVNLVQGGQGFVARFPVFTNEDGRERFWGILSSVIDIDQLYAVSGLLDDDLNLDVALTGRDGVEGDLQVFHGDARVLDDAPVVMDILLPSGAWHLHARPTGGWDMRPDNVWELRSFLLAAAALIMIPALMTGGLIKERQRNITELKQRELELQRLSRRLGLALDSSRVGVWEYVVDTEELAWDDRMCDLYDYPADHQMRGFEAWSKRLHPEDLQRAIDEFLGAIRTGGDYVSDYRLILSDGSVRHIRALGTLYQDAETSPRIVGVNWDVTHDILLNQDLTRAREAAEARNLELEQTKSRIEYNALHDSLTGLPNRRHLDEVMSAHAMRFAAGEEIAALLQIDLDRFKQINDTLGHAAGDAMLVHTAQMLRRVVSPNDFIARIGGDEFVIVCRRAREKACEVEAEMAELSRRIIAALRNPMIFEGHECRVGVSIGIAGDMDQIADPLRLAVHADIALYRAKSRGRNGFQFFNDQLHTEIVTTKQIADDILSGLERNEFICNYQPQFCARTLEIVGVEALARWQHPTRGLLAPYSFLKIAEELNVVASIDRIVLEQTLARVKEWQEAGIAIAKASVNVSARRLNDEELICSLRELDIPPGILSFELVESIFLDDNDEIISWNVDKVKDLGIDVEIDDFGTGYASIVSLMKLKPARLKIDRQLIMPIVHSAGQRQLVKSIIDIGKSLGIDVLAEGVETMEHAKILRGLGCDALQGYAFARPMDGAALSAFVADRAWKKAS
jgi:diguanylate cyclase (GGDEF)-like protein